MRAAVRNVPYLYAVSHKLQHGGPFPFGERSTNMLICSALRIAPKSSKRFIYWA